MGVVVCITSYNFPLTNMAGKLGPALAMGNTVIVKPAPQDPLGVVVMAEVFEEAGFPPGVVNVVVSEGPAPAEALVASPDVDMISFTGSTAVGQRIGEVAGRDMKRLLMELGGKGAHVNKAKSRRAVRRAGEGGKRGTRAAKRSSSGRSASSSRASSSRASSSRASSSRTSSKRSNASNGRRARASSR